MNAVAGHAATTTAPGRGYGRRTPDAHAPLARAWPRLRDGLRNESGASGSCGGRTPVQAAPRPGRATGVIRPYSGGLPTPCPSDTIQPFSARGRTGCFAHGGAPGPRPEHLFPAHGPCLRRPATAPRDPLRHPAASGDVRAGASPRCADRHALFSEPRPCGAQSGRCSSPPGPVRRPRGLGRRSPPARRVQFGGPTHAEPIEALAQRPNQSARPGARPHIRSTMPGAPLPTDNIPAIRRSAP